MNSRRKLAHAAAALLIGLAGCTAGRLSPPVPQGPLAARAVLVSFDGMAGQRLERLLATPGALPAGGLARLARQGFFALRSIPSTPSLTSAAHATHVTGA